jgi:hypothetical protein
MNCIDCAGQGTWYGLAPHKHVINSTEFEAKITWPSNFFEDPEAEGCGVWTCETCGGRGEIVCACKSEDSLCCFDLRYFGHFPANENEYGEKCECSCHDRFKDWDE